MTTSPRSAQTILAERRYTIREMMREPEGSLAARTLEGHVAELDLELAQLKAPRR